MSPSRRTVTGGLAALTAALAGAAGAAGALAAAASAELVVRNESFSTFVISVVDAGRGEAEIGQAPPEFTNTLFFPAGAGPARITFRARLSGSRDILHESDPIAVRGGTRLRWTLPSNTLEVVRARSRGSAGRAPAARVRASR